MEIINEEKEPRFLWGAEQKCHILQARSSLIKTILSKTLSFLRKTFQFAKAKVKSGPLRPKIYQKAQLDFGYEEHLFSKTKEYSVKMDWTF